MIYLDKKNHIAKISGDTLDFISDITYACIKLMEAMRDNGVDRKEIAHMLDGIKETTLYAIDNPDEVYGEEKDTWQPSTMC